MTTVLAGEPPAESFDRLPPRQLAPRRESWRFTYSQGSHPTELPSRGVYPPCIRQTIDSYTARCPGHSSRASRQTSTAQLEWAKGD